MMSVRVVRVATVLVFLAVSPVLAEPPFQGTVFISPDIITSADLSGLTGVNYTGRGAGRSRDVRAGSRSHSRRPAFAS